MYAKLFAQVLTSSLNEKEPVEVRGVFFLMLAAADKDGNVLGSDSTIARIINVPLEQFRSCIQALMQPDPQSRCELHEGRRVVPMERGLGYILPAYPKYSGITTDEERREYFRVKKAESRERKRNSEVTAGNDVKVNETPNRFDEFWRIYPKKEAKPKAISSWKKIKPSEVDRILKHVCDKAMTEDWKKEGGKYVPLPATYLNQRRWEDEGVTVAAEPDIDELVAREWKNSM